MEGTQEIHARNYINTEPIMRLEGYMAAINRPVGSNWPRTANLPHAPEDNTATVKAGEERVRGGADAGHTRSANSMPSSVDAPTQGFEDPLANSMARLQLRQNGESTALLDSKEILDGNRPGHGVPGHVLYWKKGEARGNSPSVAKVSTKPLPAGTKLGVNAQGTDVSIKRLVGSAQGYENKWQAIAVARLGGAEHAVVVNVGNKWHAYETTAAVDAKVVATDKTRVMQAIPSSADIKAAQQEVASLQSRLSQLKGMHPTPSVRDQIDQVSKQLTAANLRRAALILGVPESDIKFQVNVAGRQTGVINIIPDKDANSAGNHGPVPGPGGDRDFKLGMRSAFDIKYATLDDPQWAQLTLFHEVEHENHWHMAQEWVQRYQDETGRLFVREGLQYFKQWMEDQASKVKPPRLSKADADLVVDVAGNFDGMTEARANIRQALLAYQLGQPDLAAKAIRLYAWALAPKSQGGGAKYATPHPKSEFMLGLHEEIRTAYKQMPKDMREKFVKAIEAAKLQYPGAWISQVKLK